MLCIGNRTHEKIAAFVQVEIFTWIFILDGEGSSGECSAPGKEINAIGISWLHSMPGFLHVDENCWANDWVAPRTFVKHESCAWQRCHSNPWVLENTLDINVLSQTEYQDYNYWPSCCKGLRLTQCLKFLRLGGQKSQISPPHNSKVVISLGIWLSNQALESSRKCMLYSQDLYDTI